MPLPHRGDKCSELMGYTSLNAPISEADDLKEVSMSPGSNATVSSAALSGVATYTDRAAC